MMSRSLPSTSRRRRALESMSQSGIVSRGGSRSGRMRRQLHAEHLATNTVASPVGLKSPVRRETISRRPRTRRQRQHQCLDNSEGSNPCIESQLVAESAVNLRSGERMSRRRRTIEAMSQSQPVRAIEPRQKERHQSGEPIATIGLKLPDSPKQLPAPHYCLKCNAKKFAFESLHFCCGNGEIQIATNEYPAELRRLFTSADEDAMHFKKYARLYNNLFAFSSLGGGYDANNYKGIFVFKAHGQMYHSIPDLIPGDGKARYLQLYFYDGLAEATKRIDSFPEIRDDIIAILMNVSKDNPYARFFRNLREVPVNEDTTIVLNTNTVPDQRVYNAPSVDEVAGILPDNAASSQSSSPHVVVRGKTAKTHRIQHYFGCYDPLQYPLLFPKGECGWTQGLKKTTWGGNQQAAMQVDPVMSCVVHTTEELLTEEASRSARRNTKADKFVSAREYYAYKLQIRPNNLLLRAGKCFQQYIVDMYIKVENTRLDFFRNNQATIRADLYQGVLDSLDCGETIAANIGRRVILPPLYIGGPRDMKRRYFNAMALVQKFGKPDLFVTMTCNPNWPEIKNELSDREQAQDRPDLVARIFHAKLMALKEQIMKQTCFGEVAAMIYVVEFQKRGLPHAHFLIILKPEFKLKRVEDYDKFVCAEIPSVNSPTLQKIVLKHMMHGPCGSLNPKCSCMRRCGMQLFCKYGFPRHFSDTTTVNKDGYPLYKRMHTGETVKIRGAELDNRWVIPYNPYLSTLFDSHINVEVCSTIKAVKYLYKYVYKGHDRIKYNIIPQKDKVVDEIEENQSGRWISPCEAAWRIFSFDLFQMHPPVQLLPVHLPNMQNIHLRSHERLKSVVSNDKRSKTPLTEFFAANAAVPGGTGYLYGEFCERFRWDPSPKKWRERKTKKKVVGRLAFVYPAEGERFFLRLLLINVWSPTSFEGLRTVHGHVYGTFQDAALKLGLLEDDDVGDLCMSEAKENQLPVALRRLFATILIFCQPKDPLALWSKYYAHMSEDLEHQYPGHDDKVQRLTVRSIEQYLEAMGKSMISVGLSTLCSGEENEFQRTKDSIDALDAPIPQTCIDCIDMLNAEQLSAFSCIMEHVQAGKSGAFFIDGPGGTGKTFLYNALYAKIRMMNKIVLPTATSGIAAANIPSGRTAHSRFKIPIDVESSLVCDVPKQGSLAALLKETTLIIWDEASMANKSNLESLDLLLQDICENENLFGGKLVVLGGDFRQVLPVVPLKNQKEVVQASIVTSYIWPQLTKFRLTENQRAKQDPEFSAFLLALGNGELQQSENTYVQLPGNISNPFTADDNPVSEVTKAVFPEFFKEEYDSNLFTERAILTPLNDNVDCINTSLIDQFPRDPVVYKSFDTMLSDTCDVYPTEFLNKLCPGGLSPHELVLKKNCPVIWLRNLLPSAGLCNGTRLICKSFFLNVVLCVIVVGQYKGNHVYIPRINLRPSASARFPFQFERKQFPLKLSFAMTINKSQGQTLNRVSVYLPQPCFSHGQLCVALSRAKKREDVTVFSTLPPEPFASTCTKNVVYFEVLRLFGIC